MNSVKYILMGLGISMGILIFPEILKFVQSLSFNPDARDFRLMGYGALAVLALGIKLYDEGAT